MIAGSGELDKAGAKTQCFFNISLELKLYIENTYYEVKKGQIYSKMATFR